MLSLQSSKPQAERAFRFPNRIGPARHTPVPHRRSCLPSAHHFYISRIMKMNHTPSALLSSAAGFAALGSEQRLAVLITLVRAGPDGISIGVLGERSGITGSTLTHHVKVLVNAGLVQQTRDGRRILCAANFETIEALSSFLMSQCCRDSDAPHEAHSHD